MSKNDVLSMSDWCSERNIQLMVDESFVDFTYGFQYNSLLYDDILETHASMCVMKSISKSYGVPGLRLGVFASANKDIISKTKKDVSTWNINSFAEFYMQIYGKYAKDYVKACEQLIQERNLFFNDLKRIEWLRVIPSQANYFLYEITEKYTSHELSKILLDKYNILIKDCSTKVAIGGKNYIRLAVRT